MGVPADGGPDCGPGRHRFAVKSNRDVLIRIESGGSFGKQSLLVIARRLVQRESLFGRRQYGDGCWDSFRAGSVSLSRRGRNSTAYELDVWRKVDLDICTNSGNLNTAVGRT